MVSGGTDEMVEAKVFCSVAETANQLGITEKTIRNWMSTGQIPFVKILSKTVRIRQSDINKIITEGSVGTLDDVLAANKQKKRARSSNAIFKQRGKVA